MSKLKYNAIPESGIEPYEVKEEILALAEACINNEFIIDKNDKHIESLHKFLTWIKSDSPYANAFWHWVHKNKMQFPRRDDYIFKLWATINDEKNSNIEIKKTVENQLTHWSYYQNHFFHWFLNRYHIPYARAVFSDSWLVKYIHLLILLLGVGLFILSFFNSRTLSVYPCFSLSALLIVPFIGLIVSLVSNLKFPYFIHSMVPRLAVTIAIGYLFLISVPDFVAKIYRQYGMFSNGFLNAASITMLLFMGFLIALNIHKRVKPPLNFCEIISRTGHILAISLNYSFLGLLIFEPILFYSVRERLQAIHYQPGFSQLFFFTIISLTIGVVLQLIWEEKPVTEPL